MRNTIFATVILVVAIVTVTGCKKPEEQCAAGDSPAVCKEVQKCFQSGTSVEVCREGEKDANAIESKKTKP
jgi:hypothetical protein